MNVRKGFRLLALGAFLFLLSGMIGSGNAGQGEDVVAMMTWWENYGRYWVEMGTVLPEDGDIVFAWLESAQ
ncbi:MAG: hypothetical protein KDI15_14255 [Thiothrix sp.]|nr:hypothetical protein [Thiothrix sp.]HPE61818.1 hypothetical protein [Thiolinea sp.]